MVKIFHMGVLWYYTMCLLAVKHLDWQIFTKFGITIVPLQAAPPFWLQQLPTIWYQLTWWGWTIGVKFPAGEGRDFFFLTTASSLALYAMGTL